MKPKYLRLTTMSTFGYFASTGFETYFEISRSFIQKLQHPYSDCSTDFEEVDPDIYEAIKK